MQRTIPILMLLGILSLSVCYADTMDIADIHDNFTTLKNDNICVNVIGVVTAKFNDKTVVIQDKTAGIWLYDSSSRFSSVSAGDELNITGTLTTYNGLREIKPINISIISRGNELPAPKLVYVEDILNNKSLQGTLVELKKVKVSDVNGKNSAFQTYLEK